MTTPNERELEALLRECYEWLFESKTDGPRVSEGAIAKGYYTEAFAEFHNRLQAALTRERRECTCPSGNGSLRWPCPQHPQPETPSEREARDLRHELIRVYRSIGNDEMADKHEATPPAPVDVRVAELIAAAVAWWKAHRPLSFNESQHLSNPTINCPTAAADTLAKAVCGYLLDGQQAGRVIDDAMVRRAVHAYDEWMIEHAPDETDAYHDGMRAALTAALGGGGRG